MTECKEITIHDQAMLAAESIMERALAILPRSMDKNRWKELTISAVRSNAEKLMRCDRASFMLSIYACAKLGLDFDETRGLAYIVPRAGKATFMPGYRGFILLGRRAGLLNIMTNIAYEGDEYDIWTDENGPHILHRQNSIRDIDRKPIGAYCIAQMKGEAWPLIETMAWDEIMRVRTNYAPRNNNREIVGPWVDNENAMARKTVVRAASKYWPLTEELGRAVALDEAAERDEDQRMLVPGFEETQPPTGRIETRASRTLAEGMGDVSSTSDASNVVERIGIDPKTLGDDSVYASVKERMARVSEPA